MGDDSLSRSSNGAISSADLRAARDQAMGESLRPASAGLGILYSIFAVGHLFVQPRAIAIPMSLVATGTAAVLLGAYAVLRRWAVPTQWAHPIGAGMAGLVLVNSYLHLALTADPQQTTNFILLAIGVGFFLCSVFWLVGFLLLLWISWGGIVWMATPSPAWSHFGVGLLSACVLSVIVFTVRVRVFGRLEALRVQEVRHRRELEKEVAERTRVEEALRRSEEHFRLLIENQRDIIILLNGDGTIRYQSPSAERELGYRPEEVLGKSGFDLIHPEDLPRVLKSFADIIQKPGLTPPIELRVRHKNGSWRVLEALGNNLLHEPTMVGIIVNTRDITDRKRAEEAVRDSEERYRDLFENASDAIAIVGTDGVILDVNRAMETMLGYTRAQMIGQRYHAYLAPSARASWEEYISRALAEEELPDSLEFAFIRQDGSSVTVENRTRIIRNVAGTPVALQGISRDISSRKALEQQRADFFAMLTHDIRNPLGVILGYTDLLLEEVQAAGGSSERKDLLLRLRNTLLTVHSLLANYLDFSRIEAGRLTLVRMPVELNPLLRQVGQQYEPEAVHKSLVFTLDLQENLPLVEGDPIALERVFANLILNAFKFTLEGGWVTVCSRACKNEVVVTVADTGPGIAPDELPVLFEKYRRANRARSQEGTGLGLFIVKTLVEAQGGRVTVQSVPGEGTRFSVCLPAASFSSSAAL